MVLYNTSISAFLKESDRMLHKMEQVFEIFKRQKDEIALLWRPHPLMEATVCSTRPQLYEQYLEIVEKYKREGFGIYDDSSDMDQDLCWQMPITETKAAWLFCAMQFISQL